MLQAEQLAFRAWKLIVAGVETNVTDWRILGLS
jgi:hypothetical protein